MSRPGDGDRGRRVGLLGGTFDPVHVGHLVVAEHLLVTRDLDEVRLLVAGRPWMKADRELTPGATRVELVRLALEGVDGIEADDREVRRASGPGAGRATYTADTLAELAREEPDTHWEFCVGADAANGLHRWHRVEDVLAAATIVAVQRPGTVLDPHPSVAGHLVALPVPGLDVSSTDVRERYADGAPTRFLVPPRVHHRIVALGLYRGRHG